MYRQQTSLPRLPVPPLEQTIWQYLRCVKYLVPPDQFAATRQRAAAFMASAVARRLQTRIRQDASDPAVPNWLSRWRRDEFLRDRRPPGIFASPVFAFTMSPFPRRNDQSARAAAVTHATARFFTDLRAEALPVDYHRGRPLCMDDYRSFLGAVRVPAPGRDVVVSHGRHNAYDAPRHVVVLCGGRIFRMEVLDREGRPIPAPSLGAAFQGIRDVVEPYAKVWIVPASKAKTGEKAEFTLRD